MGILLVVVGTIGITSGLLKLRDRPRAQAGLALPTIIETLLGALTLLGAGAGLAENRTLAWTLLLLTIVTVVWSSIGHARRIIAHHQARDATAEDRFKARFRE